MGGVEGGAGEGTWIGKLRLFLKEIKKKEKKSED